jgi:ATP synthase protein I
LLGFAIWEGFKLLVSVALLVAAPKLVSDLSWFALLAGLLVALKVNWLVVALIKVRQ